MSYDLFRHLGQEFASRVESFQRHDVVQTLQQCQTQGHQVYVISASIEEWVRPWCEQHGVTDVLATRVEVNDGLLTGRFSTPNCYGQEKVNRLLAVEPEIQSYLLHAYGDSRGDRELMSLADKGVWINK
jgi:HAD superfamily hydrolase (TIGR01490 family)